MADQAPRRQRAGANAVGAGLETCGRSPSSRSRPSGSPVHVRGRRRPPAHAVSAQGDRPQQYRLPIRGARWVWCLLLGRPSARLCDRWPAFPRRADGTGERRLWPAGTALAVGRFGALMADTLAAPDGVSARWKMPRVKDDTMAVTRFEAGEGARIDLEALDDPGTREDED